MSQFYSEIRVRGCCQEWGVVFLAIGNKWWHSVVPMNVLSGPAAVTRERNSALPSAPLEEPQPPRGLSSACSALGGANPGTYNSSPS